MVAARAAEGEAPPPKGVVLVGTVGKAAKDFKTSVAGQLGLRFEELLRSLPSSIRKALRERKHDFFLSAELDRLPFRIQRGLYRATYVQSDGTLRHPLREALARFASTETTDLAELVKYFFPVADPFKHEPQDVIEADLNMELADIVDCRELDVYFVDEMKVAKDRLLPAEKNRCPKGSQTDPYDSAKWPIRSPVWYVAGTLDPATMYTDALYHFENQRSSPRTLVTLPGGGHNLLGRSFPDCKEKFWAAVFEGTPRQDALASCAAKPQVRTAKAKR
jgi:pimeloyl-ACP methyl ester carboxylesterase